MLTTADISTIATQRITTVTTRIAKRSKNNNKISFKNSTCIKHLLLLLLLQRSSSCVEKSKQRLHS